MLKKILFISIIVIPLGLVAFEFILYRNLFFINSNINNYKSYPTISISDITSGRMNNILTIYTQMRIIPKLPETVKPMTRFVSLSPYVLKDGWASMELYLWDIQNEIYLNPSVKPYQFVAYFKTKINNEIYYVLVQQWLNSDKSYSFVPYVVNENRFILNGTVNPYYVNLVDSKSRWFPSAVVNIQSDEVCLAILGSGKGYCDWYSENRERNNLNLGTWPNNTKVPKIISKHPVLLFRSTLTTNILDNSLNN